MSQFGYTTRFCACLIHDFCLKSREGFFFFFPPIVSQSLNFVVKVEKRLVKLCYNSKHLGMCSVNFICFSLDFSSNFFQCEFFFAKNWRGGKCTKPVGISIPFFSLLTFTHIADHFNKIQGLQGTVFGHMEVANTECWRIVYFLPDPGRSRCTVQ